MTQLFIVMAILLSIAIGYWKKINVGLIAIAFAYFIGVVALKVSPKDLIAFWPTHLFFTILAVSLFYNFAITNGTLNYIAQFILYKTRKHSQGIYIILYLIAVVIAAAGAGFFTTMAICCPLAVSLCNQSKKNVLVAAQVVNLGASGGANFMTSGSGIVFQGLFKDLGLETQALTFGGSIFLFTIFYPLVALLLIYIVGKFLNRNKEQVAWSIQKPEPLNTKQKQTLLLMGIMMLVVLILPNLSLLSSDIAFLKDLAKMADIGLICIVLSVVAFILNLADEKTIVSHLPWSTLIMLSGMGVLIKLATQFGLINTIADLMSQTIPDLLLPVAFALVAGLLSLFSSTLSVVVPTLFPIVTSMMEIHPNLQANILFVAIVTGALSTNVSPFSSAGSLIQASLSDKNEREVVFRQQILYGIPLTFSLALLSIFIFSLFTI